MNTIDWEVSKTEAGLQRVLGQLQECKDAGDLVEVGNGLLALSFLVCWVRSDTDQHPFVRSREIALEALDAFRQTNHVKGQIRSLVRAVPGSDPKSRESILCEAEVLAEASGDEDSVASVLAARARALALSDRGEATKIHKRVLEIYRRTGNRRGIAWTLFGLAISDEPYAEKRDYAIEGAQLNRLLGDPRQAAKCVMLALMSAEHIQPLSEIESLAKEGLNDALLAGATLQEGTFYKKLALIAVAKGDAEEAEKYHRWANDIKESDGSTPLERWKRDVEMTKTIISMSKIQGNDETVKIFKAQLKKLKSEKPK